jgi:signal transduction histidine kinase/CheY-like chemotaxis protein
MASETPKAPSYVIVMGDADRDVLDALKDRRASLQSEVLETHSVDEAVHSILQARPDLAVVPEDPAGQSHLDLCERVKRLNPRIATVVLRETLSEIPPQHPAVDDSVATGNNEEMMARIHVLLRLRTFNARARAIRQRLLDAFGAFDLSTELLDDGRLLPPSKVDYRQLLDMDEIRDHEAALSKLGHTSFACYLYAPEPECVSTSAPDGCLRGVCPVSQAMHGKSGFDVASDECRVAAWRCARDAMLACEPQVQLCPGGYQIAAYPVSLRFRGISYPLLAIAVALPSAIDFDQLDRLAERVGEDAARLRRAVVSRPLPELSRVHLEALQQIEASMADSLSRQVSNEYATAYNVLVEAVERADHDRALTRRSHQLQRANERLRETNRLRNEFLANVSHELKTPMTSIIGFVTLLLRGSAGDLPEKAEHFLERVLANARTLHAAIDDVLDLAQLGRAEVEIRPARFDLAKLIHECAEHIRPALDDKPVEARVDLPADLPELETDRQRLAQVLDKLLSNAAKFTHAGSITISAQHVAAPTLPRVAIRIADTGVGLPADAVPHIFEEFRQVDGSATRHHGGTGLGLSLVKKLCGLLGGELTVESEENHGSIFTVTLPVSLPQLQEQRHELTQQARAGDPDPDDRSTPIVLVVTESDPGLVLQLRRWAKPHDVRVASAFSFEEALTRARAILPFAVLLDVAIPGHEVWELADEMRADPRSTDTPLIVASATDDAAIADAAGATERLAKPVDRDAFLNAIERLHRGEAVQVLAIVPDADERDRIRQALHRSAYRVLACPSVTAAAHYADTHFDVVVLDPEADGQGDLTALGSIRAGTWARAPLVAYVSPDANIQADTLYQDVSAVVERDGDDTARLVEAISRARATARVQTPTEPD